MKLFKFYAYKQIYVMYYYVTYMEIVESNVYVLLGSEQKSHSNDSPEVK